MPSIAAAVAVVVVMGEGVKGGKRRERKRGRERNRTKKGRQEKRGREGWIEEDEKQSSKSLFTDEQHRQSVYLTIGCVVWSRGCGETPVLVTEPNECSD